MVNTKFFGLRLVFGKLSDGRRCIAEFSLEQKVAIRFRVCLHPDSSSIVRPLFHSIAVGLADSDVAENQLRKSGAIEHYMCRVNGSKKLIGVFRTPFMMSYCRTINLD